MGGDSKNKGTKKWRRNVVKDEQKELIQNAEKRFESFLQEAKAMPSVTHGQIGQHGKNTLYVTTRGLIMDTTTDKLFMQYFPNSSYTHAGNPKTVEMTFFISTSFIKGKGKGKGKSNGKDKHKSKGKGKDKGKGKKWKQRSYQPMRWVGYLLLVVLILSVLMCKSINYGSDICGFQEGTSRYDMHEQGACSTWYRLYRSVYP